MRSALLVLTVAVTIVGCGTDGKGRGIGPPPSPATRFVGPPASSRDDSVNLPQLGTLTVRCPARGRYSLRFVVEPRRASERLTVREGRKVVRTGDRDPGEKLTVKVATRRRHVGPDVLRETAPVAWRIVQDTEPHTIRGAIRLVLAESDVDPPPACSFERLRTSVTTQSHSAP